MITEMFGIIRKMGVSHAHFALEDGSGRVAEFYLPWRGNPFEDELASLGPSTSPSGSFEAWVREGERARAFARLKPDPSVFPKWRVDDRVVMLKHSDRKADARATIFGEGRPRLIFDGSTPIQSLIEFDEPQCDLIDEELGRQNEWEETTVLEEYLLPRRCRRPRPVGSPIFDGSEPISGRSRSRTCRR